MILSLLLGILTTWILFSWGDLLGKWLPTTESAFTAFLYRYLVGLIGLCFFANALSLFIGLNQPLLLPILCIPVLRQLPSRKTVHELTELFLPNSRPLQLLSLTSVLLLVAMHAWEIKHPDSLSYQNELIRYALQSGHPTGLIQIQNQLGYGGAWYAISALFSFHFLIGQLMTFVNLSLIGVTVCCLIKQVDAAATNKNLFALTGCLLLLGIGFYEYSFFRLALTSAAPDTPAALIGLATLLYFLYEKRSGWLLMAGCITAVTIKLSLAPILLLPVWHLIKAENRRQVFSMVTIGLLIALPFLVKNVRSTGYLIYPLPNTRILSANYTPSATAVQAEADYIKAYARKEKTERNARGVTSTLSPSLRQWVPHWWKQQTHAEKTMLILTFIALTGAVVYRKKIQLPAADYWQFMTTVSLGILFWFYQAPAIRFGSAFLLAPWLLYGYPRKEQTAHQPTLFKISSWIIRLIEIGLLLTALAYLGYRLYYFMDGSAFWWPKGPVV